MISAEIYRLNLDARCAREVAATSCIFEHLASALEPRTPSAARCTDLRQNVLARTRALGPPGTRTLRAAEGHWHALGPGVGIKLLRGDDCSGNMTAFIRMLPGSSLASHVHRQPEECFVVEGEIFIGAHRLSATDMHVAAAGTSHGTITSPMGAVLLVRSQLLHIGPTRLPVFT